MSGRSLILFVILGQFGQAYTGELRLTVVDATGLRLTSLPGRSLTDLVDSQPGWLVEANGILHPRGSEYQTQYVRNVADSLNVINFAGLFSGTALAAPRSIAVRLQAGF